MTAYLGDFADNATVIWSWDTVGSTGASITPSVAGTISVYKDSGLTQTVVGVTDTRSFDAITGVHQIVIATTDAFYATGSDYSVVLTGATVDSVSGVNAALFSFSIENRFTNIAQINSSATAAVNIAASALAIEPFTVQASPAPTATTFATNLTEATDNHYADRTVIMTSGISKGQIKELPNTGSYTGASKTLVFGTSWVDTVVAGDTGVVV